MAERAGCVRGISEEASLPILGSFDALRMVGESTISLAVPKVLQLALWAAA